MKLIRFLVMVAVILGVIGYFRGWYSVEKTGDEKFTVSINKNKVKEDAARAAEKTKEVAEKVADKVAKKKTMKGRLVTWNPLTRSIVLESQDGTKTTFQTDEKALTTEILSGLVSKQVTVTYVKKDDKLVATAIK
ncbi:MAG TPA: hypothetical protein ENK43_17890 [Planctomycetes bacterium]|nr:hypothetical protein [Planctomycetota bacterium]